MSFRSGPLRNEKLSVRIQSKEVVCRTFFTEPIVASAFPGLTQSIDVAKTGQAGLGFVIAPITTINHRSASIEAAASLPYPAS
jgi:hypothetical protein